MNPKRVYGSYTLIGIIVLRVYDPNFGVHFVPKVQFKQGAMGWSKHSLIQRDGRSFKQDPKP